MPRIKEETTTLTPEQRSIVERVNAQDTEWFNIDPKSMNDFSLSNNPFNIDPNYPIAAKLQREKKYVFRWCERDARRVDQLTRSQQPPLRWAIVNRQTLPELSEYVDPVLGCVCCLDQMLLFKPYAHAIMVRKAKDEISKAKLNTPKSKLQAEGVDVQDGDKYKITGGDIVEYEDTREATADIADFIE